VLYWHLFSFVSQSPTRTSLIGPLLNCPTKWDRSGAGALFEGVVKMVCVIVLSAVMGEYLSEDMGSACVGAFVRVCGTPVKFGQ